MNDSVKKEVQASKILKSLGIPVLDYDSVLYNGEKVSVSKFFTNKNLGYVTAGNLNMNFTLDTDCKEYHLMNLADYLVGNSDRHQDNWGYLIDAENMIVGFAPILEGEGQYVEFVNNRIKLL